jgi:glycosyltransferase involved in cell wall biosynthesis
MKVVMFNDCSFVGETLLKYLSPEVEREHIRRTRGLWSKTLGLVYNVLRAKGDVYHANYLLQDCYVASKFGRRPLVGHAMGSDLREEIKTRSWGWMVKHNLRSCDKILLAQPTLLEVAREFNDTAEYLPIPFDPERFFPRALNEGREEKQVFLASTHDFEVKGTDKFLYALASAKCPMTVRSFNAGKDVARAQRLASELKLKMEFIDRVSHDKMNELFWDSDLVLGSFGVGQLDTVAIEGMACGRPVVHSILKKFFPTCPLEDVGTVDVAAEIISKLLTDEGGIANRVQSQLDFVNSTHSAPILAKRLLTIYSELA